jgi:hypothetical protein
MVVMSDLDKRSFQRMSVHSPVSIEYAGQVFQGVCLDLSATGMSVSLGRIALSEGDPIAVTLGEGQSSSPLRADAKVLRVEDLDTGIKVGIEFTQLK